MKVKPLTDTQVSFLNDAGEVDQEESKSGSRHYQASLGWRLWAGCVALLMVCHVIAALLEIPNPSSEFMKQKTLSVANKVREIITNLTVVVMEVHLLSKSSLALLTASQCLDLLPASREHSGSLSSHVLVALSGVLFIISSSSVLTSYVVHAHMRCDLTQGGVVYVFTQSVETIIYILVNAFVITFLYIVIQILCGALRTVRKQLKEAWMRKKRAGDVVTPPIPYCKMCLREIKAKIPSKDFGSNTNSQTKRHIIKVGEDLTKITKNSREILMQLHALQRSLNHFLGLPVTVIMLISVVYSILACFFLSYMNMVTAWMRVMAASYFTMALMPQLLLSNFPVLLQTQVGIPAEPQVSQCKSGCTK